MGRPHSRAVGKSKQTRATQTVPLFHRGGGSPAFARLRAGLDANRTNLSVRSILSISSGRFAIVSVPILVRFVLVEKMKLAVTFLTLADWFVHFIYLSVVVDVVLWIRTM